MRWIELGKPHKKPGGRASREKEKKRKRRQRIRCLLKMLFISREAGCAKYDARKLLMQTKYLPIMKRALNGSREFRRSPSTTFWHDFITDDIH
ncbi:MULTISPECIES: hypothetical protein [unclassified Nitrobacter]|uniref:hypothetical protein n=1 Tax=unclassified Nitrobacter TaxID=2620411 RepID=UPI001AC9043B|nr:MULTISPECIES: hypothetical protein [unclassified Nitrobacter]MBN9148160.1 hypothetical protein [Nitrobacter sp.]